MPTKLSSNPTVFDVLGYIFSHLFEILFRRWNWKSAVLSGVIRSFIYFFTHIKFGWNAAFSAMSLEFVSRTINSGVCASIGQSFHYAKPHGMATFCLLIMLPAP